MGRTIQHCSLLCLAIASCTLWNAFVSPSPGGPEKLLQANRVTSVTPARPVQRATSSVSLAAPLCLLAVAWVARSSKKPLKRPVVHLRASWRPLPALPQSIPSADSCAGVTSNVTELMSFEEVESIHVTENDQSFMQVTAEPASQQAPKPAAGKRKRSSRTQRRSIGARLARPTEYPPAATELPYDISKVRSKLQSGLCGHGPSRTACRSREVCSQVSSATGQGIVVYSGSRFSICSVFFHSEGL